MSYHVSTLFPPVRAHGWYEIRMVDAQRDDDWVVPLAVIASIVDDPVAADTARAAVEPVATAWSLAAREGLANDALATSARGCFDAALRALSRRNLDRWTLDRVTTYFERFVDLAAEREPAWF